MAIATTVITLINIDMKADFREVNLNNFILPTQILTAKILYKIQF